MSSPINYDSDKLDTITIGTLGTADISELSNTMMGPYTLSSPQLGGALGSLTYPTSAPTYGNITFGPGGSGSYLTNNSTGNNWATITNAGAGGTTGSGTFQVKGDAVFEGTVKINGQDLGKFMETISKRLAILVPDPAKLEHFEALKKAYNHYKTLEALCEIPKEEEEK